MGDRLWTGTPSRCRTRHPGLLSLSLSSVVRLEWVPDKSWGSKQAHHVIHQPISMILPCWLNVRLKRLASGDQCWLTGSRSTLEVCLRRCAIQFTLLYLLIWCDKYQSLHQDYHKSNSIIKQTNFGSKTWRVVWNIFMSSCCVGPVGRYLFLSTVRYCAFKADSPCTATTAITSDTGYSWHVNSDVITCNIAYQAYLLLCPRP